jgi:ubiquinone/menaquinone biosynthesis C-methylase UbiE/predicted esterase
MRTVQTGLVTALLAGGLALAQAPNYAPPPPNAPDAATREAIARQSRQLEVALADLRRRGVTDPVLAEVEVYLKAADWIVRFNEFFHKDSGAWTKEALATGLQRAEQAARGEAPWLRPDSRSVVRSYRSRVDGSVQPYAVTYPPGYGGDPKAVWRLDVVLHGRDASLTEAKFLHQFAGKAAAKDQTWVQLDVYGRGNNAYRWAGETDVLEAIDAFLDGERRAGRGPQIDPRRTVLRGFSMGGAGTWHLGLHRPDRWCVMGPGAGFSTTRGYLKNLPDPLPPYLAAGLHVYDAVDYAENAAMIPVVAYAGDNDPQRQATLNIEERLKPLGIPITFLQAPGLAHQMPAEWQKKAQAEYEKYAGPGKGRPAHPERVRFVTYTLKYPKCEWVELLALEKHYKEARVDATWKPDGITVTTSNVRSLRLGGPGGPALPERITVNGKRVMSAELPGTKPTEAVVELIAGNWFGKTAQEPGPEPVFLPRKSPGLQGPIDDAFAGPFLCVRGTGRPESEAGKRYADAELKRFEAEWDQFMRGKLPVKDDTAVTAEDIATKHLILFGDSSSNAVIRRVLAGLNLLPVEWEFDKLQFAGRSVDATTHLPVLIHPNPLNTKRYVVLNSGHTFHAADFKGTNALLYPRLGDYALLKLPPADAKDPLAAEVVTAGMFDDDWKVPAAPPARYENRRVHDPNGIGKFYMGREIAMVMGHQAADWLDRPEREQEEAPSKLIEALKIKPGSVVADVGAGSGYLTFRLADKVGPNGKVLAVDIQDEMLALIRQRAKAKKVTNVEPVKGAESDPKLPAGAVDLILMVDVYHEFEFPFEMTEAMVKALKPGGRLAFVEYRLEDPEVPIKLVHKMSERQVKKEMAIHPLRYVQTLEDLPRQHIIIFEKK